MQQRSIRAAREDVPLEAATGFVRPLGLIGSPRSGEIEFAQLPRLMLEQDGLNKKQAGAEPPELFVIGGFGQEIAPAVAKSEVRGDYPAVQLPRIQRKIPEACG